MRPLSLLIGISLLSLTVTACGDKDTGGAGTTATDGGAGDGGTSDGGTSDGGTSDGGTSDGGTSDGGTTVDADNDGWTVGDGDCDDTNAAIYPGAADEPYDGIDSDCDGASDYDWDGDGYDSSDYGGDDCNDADSSIHPDAVDTPYDGINSDCGDGSDFDADGDGADSESWGGNDCDDTDSSIAPGAYDRPNDGSDQDCDGSDRVLDGVVLDEGERESWEIEVPLTGYGQIDVAVLLDTTCSMSSTLSSLDFDDLTAELTAVDSNMAYGFATFDDYDYGSLGASVDLPFILRQQVTTDLDALQTAIASASLHSGGDGPEASVEALYQALSGAGYDQACDGSYDSSTDILPFLADAGDPFGGTGGEAGDASTALGDAGGLGFRDGSARVIFYITDNYLRDPDGLVSTATTTPDGCPMDAGSNDVADLAIAENAYLYGIATTTTPEAGMQELADMSASTLDINGDGIDDPLVDTWSSDTSLGSFIGADLAEIADQVAPSSIIGTISLEPTMDAYGLIIDISPDPASDIDTSTTDSVVFTLTLEGTVPATSEALDFTLALDVLIDGEVVDTVSVAVEIPPA